MSGLVNVVGFALAGLTAFIVWVFGSFWLMVVVVFACLAMYVTGHIAALDDEERRQFWDDDR